jgi:hypothetical protein
MAKIGIASFGDAAVTGQVDRDDSIRVRERAVD